MPIYTRTGDDGTTGLFGNQRVAKDHVRIEAYGTIDELSSTLGLCAAELTSATLTHQAPANFSAASFRNIQSVLFDVGADLATIGGKASVTRVESATKQLEACIDESEARLSPLHSFVMPGGTRLAAALHVARTVARRAERRLCTLIRLEAEHPEAAIPLAFGVYLNRLSDLCFSWARLANSLADSPDVPWTRG